MLKKSVNGGVKNEHAIICINHVLLGIECLDSSGAFFVLMDVLIPFIFFMLSVTVLFPDLEKFVPKKCDHFDGPLFTTVFDVLGLVIFVETCHPVDIQVTSKEVMPSKSRFWLKVREPLVWWCVLQLIL